MQKKHTFDFKDLKKSPLNIVLFEPQIPPNTGNISRLSVGTGSTLHIVGKTGFSMDEKAVRRAGLDHWEHLNLFHYKDLAQLQSKNTGARFFYFSKFAVRSYLTVNFNPGDFLVFGSETQGLPEKLIKENMDNCLYIPTTDNVRSLNLANACAIVVYEAIRQIIGLP